MKTTEYKEEVKSLVLTPEFKEQLKSKMLEEYTSAHPDGVSPKITESAGGLKKYSRYIALAASLLLVVSTVSVVSIAGLRSRFTSSGADSAPAEQLETALMNENAAQDAAAVESDTEAVENGAVDGGYPAQGEEAPEAPRSAVGEDDFDQPDGDAAEEGEIAEDSEDVAEDELIAEEDAEEIDAPEPYSDETFVWEVNPASNSGFSTAASADYDGSYDGGAYILEADAGSGTLKADEILSSVSPSPKYLVPASYGGATGSFPVEAPAGFPNEGTDADEEAKVDMPAYDDSAVDVDSLFEDLGYRFSYEYYDIRDGVIADLDEVGLIRFKIVDAYDGYDDIYRNAEKPLNIDTDTQTLYSVRISYDYFESEELDVKAQLINTGTAKVQLIGRPLMEGEYVAVVYTNGDGILEPVPQLIYSVHEVNGLDIAYHVYSDDGFRVDPGDTNMGLNDEERAVMMSTVNNPEIYTQKAAVRELTSYLRRNILRMEPNLIDFTAAPEEPADTPDAGGEAEVPVPQEPVDAKSYLGAKFPTGALKYEDGKVNGITVGDSLADAQKAFYLTDYVFTPDCTISLVSSDEDGGWYVRVTFADGVVKNIERVG